MALLLAALRNGRARGGSVAALSYNFPAKSLIMGPVIRTFESHHMVPVKQEYQRLSFEDFRRIMEPIGYKKSMLRKIFHTEYFYRKKNKQLVEDTNANGSQALEWLHAKDLQLNKRRSKKCWCHILQRSPQQLEATYKQMVGLVSQGEDPEGFVKGAILDVPKLLTVDAGEAKEVLDTVSTELFLTPEDWNQMLRAETRLLMAGSEEYAEFKELMEVIGFNSPEEQGAALKKNPSLLANRLRRHLPYQIKQLKAAGALRDRGLAPEQRLEQILQGIEEGKAAREELNTAKKIKHQEKRERRRLRREARKAMAEASAG
eukprot:CAMPEP_0113935970 /NCGR_PEP_ID=MMETSP1339-20121228/2978_1 /TAXON_ID=94617 /ORGANISM="Fibrocapsa japonica" /LENGTH=316 /DNA_ID=CAMNT_0000938279 /DNA_START=75 /DNA_END=1025 /DNA_ORIENTATION=- /assembly_acc=CAM_ASM_000762